MNTQPNVHITLVPDEADPEQEQSCDSRERVLILVNDDDYDDEMVDKANLAAAVRERVAYYHVLGRRVYVRRDDGEDVTDQYTAETMPARTAVTELDRALAELSVAQHQVAELLERIGRVTGERLSTAPTNTAVAEGLRVLDSLTSPTDLAGGWYWGDPIGTASDGLTGPWPARSGVEQVVAEHADELPHGYVLVLAERGQLLAPMYVAPRRGGN